MLSDPPPELAKRTDPPGRQTDIAPNRRTRIVQVVKERARTNRAACYGATAGFAWADRVHRAVSSLLIYRLHRSPRVLLDWDLYLDASRILL